MDGGGGVRVEERGLVLPFLVCALLLKRYLMPCRDFFHVSFSFCQLDFRVPIVCSLSQSPRRF